MVRIYLCPSFTVFSLPLYIIHWLSTTLTKKEKEDIQNGMIFASTEDQIVTLSQFLEFQFSPIWIF